jgi:hypothetical protein
MINIELIDNIKIKKGFKTREETISYLFSDITFLYISQLIEDIEFRIVNNSTLNLTKNQEDTVIKIIKDVYDNTR